MAKYEIDETKTFKYFTGSIPFGGTYDSDTTDVKITNVLTSTENLPNRLYENNPWYICNKYIQNFALQNEIEYDVSQITAWNDYTHNVITNINTKPLDYVMCGIVSTYDTQYNSYFNNIPEQTYPETLQGVSKAGFLKFSPKDFYFDIKYFWVTAKDTFLQSRISVDTYKQNPTNYIITGIIAYLRNKNTNKYVCCGNTNSQAGLCFQPIMEITDGENVSHIYAPFFTANNQTYSTERPYNVIANIPLHYTFNNTNCEIIEPCTLEYNRSTGIIIYDNLTYSTIAIRKRMSGTQFILDFVNGFTEEQMLKYVSSFGFYFSYNNDMYMPIIENGYITKGNYVKGSDIDITDSLLKEMTETIGNDINVNPDSFDDIEIEMPIGLGYTAGGLVNYYGVTSQNLEDISANLSNWQYVETGKNVMDNLISLKCFALPPNILYRGTPKNITIAGTDTLVQGTTIDATYSYINLGSVTIPHRYNDFRDYAPYTKCEIFIPCCGWLQLPSTVMGKTLKCYMVYDIVTGGCKAFVYQNETIVGEISGCIAYDIPFSAVAVGTKTAGMINGITGVATSLVGLGAGIATANPFAIASGGIGLISSLSNTVATNNANYTITKGNTGDMCNFGGVKFMFVKITRPVSKIPNGFEKTVGYLYNQSEILNNMSGYTVCENAKITGNMLENERTEIEQILNTGVIL